MWCIGELHLPYERIDAGHVHGVVDTPDYLAMNPNGRVPTLVDGDSPPLWETGAILRYLANSYAPDDFWPAEATARGRRSLEYIRRYREGLAAGDPPSGAATWFLMRCEGCSATGYDSAGAGQVSSRDGLLAVCP